MSTPLLQSLPTAAKSSEPTWLATLRLAAATSLKKSGLPTSKTEAWRFTPLKALTKTEFVIGPKDADASADMDWAKSMLPDSASDACQIFVVNGFPVLPQDLPLSVNVSMLNDETSYVATAKTVFAKLNTAMFDNGLVVDIAANASVSKQIHLVYVGRNASSETVVYPRVLVRVGANSKASIAQTFLGDGATAHLTNGVTEIQVAENATLQHTCIVQPKGAAKNLLATHITQNAHSNYTFDSALLGGSLTRLDIEVDLEGSGATASLGGVYVTEKGDHTNCHAKVNHLTTHGTSHVNFRGVLTGASEAVFDAIAVVAKDAQKTSAHQNNRNLILSDGATVHTKPHLEIDADDVKCSHGATIGALDPKQLFYLRSRGMNESVARSMLTYAFLREAIERIPDPATVQMVSRLVLEKCDLDANLNMEEM